MSSASRKALASADLRDTACVVIGTRPGIVMLAPVIRELERRQIPHFVLHTSQHYSRDMDAGLMAELELSPPAHRLRDVERETLHGAQTAAMLRGCEGVFLAERPRLVLVGGDANTNLAGALAARKLHIEVGHVEAGERSDDWRMPEEHNRVLIDHISDHLFATNEKAARNLAADNVRGRVVISGNPLVDAVRENLELARGRSTVLERLGVAAGRYLVATAHREENVDEPATLGRILEGLGRVARAAERPVVFAVHPRTRKRLGQFGLEGVPGVVMTGALGYLDFLRLLDGAALALTDSGGVQQEACMLGVPCVTLRPSTEWSETLDIGANLLAGTSPDAIVKASLTMLGADCRWSHAFGDGHAAARIAETVESVLTGAAPAVIGPVGGR